ncbi:MAG: DNA-binding response regulator [Planctomycetes bacterium RBG_19FT_COMBO_48_8]|nr:MAG: DNA-binding response regulator [Planctomycetes bacterium RBG_19FT_COMBO_48_8]
MGKRKILIIEDDKDIVEMLDYNLKEEGYDTISALNGEEGIALAGKERPDLIILDIMLPIMDGFEVCRTLKNDDKLAHIPIIILSAKSQETDKVVGLELGADDYVTKPFSPRELIARTRAIMRRGRGEHISNRIRRGQITIDRTRHKVTVGRKEISLTLTEFKLLEFMARRPGAVYSRARILDAVAGQDAIVCDRTVDAHIKSLRHKLGPAKDYIETIRGAGYRFKEV